MSFPQQSRSDIAAAEANERRRLLDAQAHADGKRANRRDLDREQSGAGRKLRAWLSSGLALGGALLAFGFAAYLLSLGPESTVVTPEGPTPTSRSATLAGLVPLAIGCVAVWAVAMRRTSAYWIAAVVAFAAAPLFLFSISLQLAAIAVILLLAATVKTTPARDVQRR